MKNYYDKAYRLTKTVRNPHHDKRCKYGEDAVTEVKENTVVFVFEGDGTSAPSVYNARGKSIARRYDFVKQILANVEAYEPTHWREQLVFQAGSDFPLCEVVDELVKAGRVTPGQILEAARVAYDNQKETI